MAEQGLEEIAERKTTFVKSCEGLECLCPNGKRHLQNNKYNNDDDDHLRFSSIDDPQLFGSEMERNLQPAEHISIIKKKKTF